MHSPINIRFIKYNVCSLRYGLKIFSSHEFYCISYSSLQTLFDVKHYLLFSHRAICVCFTYFKHCYLTYCIKSPAAVATARLRGGPTGQLPIAPTYKEL